MTICAEGLEEGKTLRASKTEVMGNSREDSLGAAGEIWRVGKVIDNQGYTV